MRRIAAILIIIAFVVVGIFAIWPPARNVVYPFLIEHGFEPLVATTINFATWMNWRMLFVGMPIGGFIVYLIFTGWIKARRWGIKSAQKDTFVPISAPLPVTTVVAPTPATPTPPPSVNPTPPQPAPEETK